MYRAALGLLIPNRDLIELPLNGRNFTQLGLHFVVPQLDIEELIAFIPAAVRPTIEGEVRDVTELATLGLLWIALVFTALLGLTRAFVPEREQRTMDVLILAPCDRSAIWLAKSIAVFLFLVVAELVALPAFSLFFEPDRLADDRGRRARERRHLRGRHANRRDGGRRQGARAGPAAALPADGDPGGRRRRRRERRGRCELPALPRALRRGLRPARVGVLRVRRRRDLTGLTALPVYDAAVTETLKRNRLPVLAGVTAGLFALSIGLIFFYAPEDADQGISQRIFYFHVPLALTAYACFALGRVEGAAAPLEARREAPTSRATSRSTRA